MHNQAEENEKKIPGEPFQSDTEKLAQRHLANPDHVITEEELRNVRVGMAPPPDGPTEEALRNADEKIADHKADSEEDTTPGSQKITPWDLIGP